MNTEMQLASRAVLASLSISQWTARKLDKTVTDEVNSQHGAHSNAGRFNKLLVPPEALEKINRAVSAARTLHDVRTVPWRRDGVRMLPTRGFLDYGRDIGKLRDDFNAAVDWFVGAYPAFVAGAEKRLGSMFNAEDYPDAGDIRKRFAFETNIEPVPTSGDFRIDIGNEALAALQSELEAKADETMANAMRSVWERVSGVVGAMAERLAAYKPAEKKGEKAEGVFRDSLVGNVRDLVAILPSLNLAEDERMVDIQERIEFALCQHDAIALRESDSLRVQTARNAKSILADINALMGA